MVGSISTSRENPLQQWCPCRRTHQLSIVNSCPPRALEARRKEQGFVRRCQRSGRTGNRGYGAYAITIQKSQGSEFPAVVTPLARQRSCLTKHLWFRLSHTHRNA